MPLPDNKHLDCWQSASPVSVVKAPCQTDTKNVREGFEAPVVWYKDTRTLHAPSWLHLAAHVCCVCVWECVCVVSTCSCCHTRTHWKLQMYPHYSSTNLQHLSLPFCDRQWDDLACNLSKFALRCCHRLVFPSSVFCNELKIKSHRTQQSS